MSATCRACGAPIEWAWTTAGALIPLDLGVHIGGIFQVDDGGTAHRATDPDAPGRRSHFVTCPHRDRLRRR